MGHIWVMIHFLVLFFYTILKLFGRVCVWMCSPGRMSRMLFIIRGEFAKTTLPTKETTFLESHCPAHQMLRGCSRRAYFCISYIQASVFPCRGLHSSVQGWCRENRREGNKKSAELLKVFIESGGGQCWFPANKNAYIQWEKYTRAINILCNSSGWACSEEGERPGRRWKIDCIKFSAVIYNNYVIRVIDRERGREKGLNNFGHPPLFMWPGQEQESETLDLQVKKKKKKLQTEEESGETRQNEKVPPNVYSASPASAQTRSPLPLSRPWSSVVLRRTPHRVTIHILLLCSMFHDNKVRRTAEVRLNSCFLGWKFQALRAICLYVHWRIWEPSIRLRALQLPGPTQPSLPPACLPACLPACPPACLLGCLLPASTPIQWELLLHFVSHRMGWFD